LEGISAFRKGIKEQGRGISLVEGTIGSLFNYNNGENDGNDNAAY
jgi:hypothetical protein